MKYGSTVIKELGKHGLRGYYFSHKQYVVLAKIKEFGAVKDKIAEWGYPEVKKADDVAEIVSELKKSTAMSETEKGCLASMILEPLFWLILLFFTGC